eukprot:Amastigsp_a176595_34.p2 type:complete len:160 gc:universal Amastigsp_a176595_34:534-55(-)
MVDGLDNRVVDAIALFERPVKGHFSQLGAHRRLGKLTKGVVHVLDAVGRQEWVRDGVIENTVDLKLHVVLRDCALVVDRDGHLFERVLVRDAIDEGNEDREPWLEDLVEPTQPLHNPSFFVWHNVDAKVHVALARLRRVRARTGCRKHTLRCKRSSCST